MCTSKGQVFVREQGLEYASNLLKGGGREKDFNHIWNYELAI